jgi:hypothetical protein
MERAAAHRDLQRPQVQFLETLPPQQRVDIPQDLSGE